MAEAGGRRATVEIRAVNHRFFDLKLRAPWLDAVLEDRLTQAIRRRAERGSFSVTLREEGTTTSSGIRVDLAAARGVYDALELLRRELAIPEPVTLALVASQPGVLHAGEPAQDVDALFAIVGPALESALDELVTMRRREGAALAADLGKRLAHLAALADEVELLAAASPEEWRRRLTDRLQKLLSPTGVALDEARLAVEVAMLADRVDVTEELVRLRSHLKQVTALCAEDTPVGRRLDFLVQELGREINTIGSKSQSAEIARRIVEAKAELEKIREQVQNVE